MGCAGTVALVCSRVSRGSAWQLVVGLVWVTALSALPGQQGQGLALAHRFRMGFSFHALPGQLGQGLVPALGSHSSSPCLPLEPTMVMMTFTAPGSPVGGVLLPGSAHRERSFYGGPAPLLMPLPIMVACLSGGPRLLPNTPSVATA